MLEKETPLKGFLNAEMKALPKIVIAEPDYQISLIMKEFIQNRNLASVIEILRDGLDALEFLKCLKTYSFRPTCIILNHNLSYFDEIITGITEDQALNEIPLIITSEYHKQMISDKYRINAKSNIIKPMQLLRCEEIIKSFNTEEFNKNFVFSGNRVPYLL